jgi:hypothetical protein
MKYILKGNEIEVGSKWCCADGGKTVIIVEEIRRYPILNHKEDNWYDVYYSLEENGEKQIRHQDSLSFQIRYCLIGEEK